MPRPILLNVLVYVLIVPLSADDSLRSGTGDAARFGGAFTVPGVVRDTVPSSGPATAPVAARAPCVPPVLLPPDHWATVAARRLAAAGAFEVGTTATGSLPVWVVARGLAWAADSAESPALRAAASSYLARLGLEHPGLAGALAGAGHAAGPGSGGAAGPGREVATATGVVAAPGTGCRTVGDARLEAGYGATRGLHRPGFGYDPDHDWTGAFPLDPVSSVAGGAAVTAGWRALGARVEVAADATGVDLLDGHLAATLGDVVLWAGRRPLRYGPGRGGGVIFSGVAPVTGVGAVVTDPIRLPWFLGLLGPVGMESFFSRARGGERIVDPWLWGARLNAVPHPRFRIGASRGTMFGGEGNTPVTVRYALQMLAGMHSGVEGEFDNHFGTVDLRYRPPGLPLDLYLEWGMNDSAGAWHSIPARLVGIEWPALPFAPGVALGAEFVHFPRDCCGNPIWYRNWAFRMGWTNDGVLLGHPVGGHGHELALRSDMVLGDGAVVLAGRAFRRERGLGNVFWPEWGGPSLGLEGSLDVRSAGGAGLAVRGFVEAGRDWRAGRVFAGVTWRAGGAVGGPAVGARAIGGGSVGATEWPEEDVDR